MCLKINDGAVFVADSHFSNQRSNFKTFLELIENKQIVTNQLFLMGDIFDFIAGSCKYFIKQNQEIINRLNHLSQEIEIFYFEGNHDYNMIDFFPNIKVIPRENQPFIMQYKEESVALSHGDIFTPKLYNFYCRIIRNKHLLKFLNYLDFGFFISKKIESSLNKKNICKKSENFEESIKKRIRNYSENIVIEGHFHHGEEFIFDEQRYINIPSLFCQKEYVVLKNGKFEKHCIF